MARRLIGNFGAGLNDRAASSPVPWLAVAAFAALLLLVSVVTACLLYRSTLKYSINYNEGWNTELVSQILAGQSPYSPGSAIVNNYPPLSFYLVAAVARLIGPVWIAGRLVAWLSFAGCGVLIVGILRLWRCGWFAALFGGLVFGAIMTTRYDTYVGMFDPQMTAHLVLLVALALVFGDRRNRPLVTVLAAAAVVIGLLIKHNVIALPIAVTIWLALFRPRQLVHWVVAGAVIAAAAAAACFLAYGNDILASMTAPRFYSPVRAYQKLVERLMPIIAPVAIAFIPAVGRPRDAIGTFCGIYLTAALAIALIGFAGDGTNFNLMFDAIIATALGVGYALGAAVPGAPARAGIGSWIAAATAGSILLSTAQVATAKTTSWRAWMTEQQARTGDAARTVALLAAAPDPALCETLLLCYWAGKAPQVDPFNFSQAVLDGRRPAGPLLSRIRAGAFAYIQAEPGRNGNLSRIPGWQAALDAHYRLVPGYTDLYRRILSDGSQSAH